MGADLVPAGSSAPLQPAIKATALDGTVLTVKFLTGTDAAYVHATEGEHFGKVSITRLRPLQDTTFSQHFDA